MDFLFRFTYTTIRMTLRARELGVAYGQEVGALSRTFLGFLRSVGKRRAPCSGVITYVRLSGM